MTLGYQIFQWNKNDIRDKPVFTSIEKSGYFDVDGKLKSEDQLDDFKAKLNSIKDYFGQAEEKPIVEQRSKIVIEES